MKPFPPLLLLSLLFGLGARPLRAEPAYPDRFVWVFGWGLDQKKDVDEISALIETAAKHGINGAVLSVGLDTLCKQTPDYFRRLDQIHAACEKNHVDLIPAIFSIGYGGGALSHDRNLAEGLPVVDAPFVVREGKARFESNAKPRLINGDFEDFNGNQLKGYNFYDQPGEIAFVDTEIKHGGKASLRLEHFTANEHGHGRIMQEIPLHPHRCYRVSVWVKTEGLSPASSFRLMALSKDQELAPRDFNLLPTSDWKKISMLLNSLDREKAGLYAGMWGGKAGKLWLDDWTVEEVGPVNLLKRPGTPVTVRSGDGKTTYKEGQDYAPFDNSSFSPWRDTGDALTLQILPRGRIKNEDRLLVSWYHSMQINDSQVTACMAEPALNEIFDHEARLLTEHLHPKRVLLNTDEVRMGGTCQACAGRNLGELLGSCITHQVEAIHRYSPEARIYVWSDMLDPNHNAHANYYLAKGDFSGSWDHIPRDLVIAVWGGEPSVASHKRLELFSLIFLHSGAGAPGFDALQGLFAPV